MRLNAGMRLTPIRELSAHHAAILWLLRLRTFLGMVEWCWSRCFAQSYTHHNRTSTIHSIIVHDLIREVHNINFTNIKKNIHTHGQIKEKHFPLYDTKQKKITRSHTAKWASSRTVFIWNKMGNQQYTAMCI